MGFSLALGVFMLAAGLYLLVAAIRGKGSVYENDNIRAGHEEKYRKTVRISCFVVSPLLILSFVAALIAYSISTDIITSAVMREHFRVFTLTSDITRWAGLVAIVVMIILTMRLSDKSIADKPTYEEGHNPAFDFEEDNGDSDSDSTSDE